MTSTALGIILDLHVIIHFDTIVYQLYKQTTMYNSVTRKSCFENLGTRSLEVIIRSNICRKPDKLN